jgi:hypothetical protein
MQATIELQKVQLTIRKLHWVSVGAERKPRHVSLCALCVMPPLPVPLQGKQKQNAEQIAQLNGQHSSLRERVQKAQLVSTSLVGEAQPSALCYYTRLTQSVTLLPFTHRQ